MSLRYVWVGLLGWHASYQSLMLHSYKRALHQYQGGWLLFESCGNLIFVSCIRNSILPALQYNVHRAPGGGGGGRGTSAPPPPHFFAQKKYKRFKTYWRGNYILFYDLNFIALIFYCSNFSYTKFNFKICCGSMAMDHSRNLLHLRHWCFSTIPYFFIHSTCPAMICLKFNFATLEGSRVDWASQSITQCSHKLHKEHNQSTR